MGLTIVLVRTKVQAVFVLTQVVGAIHIAKQGNLAAICFRPGFQFRNFIGQEILVRHRHHWHRPSAIRLEPLANALGIISSGIDDLFAVDVTLLGMHRPCAVRMLGYSCRAAKAFNLCAHLARAFR